MTKPGPKPMPIRERFWEKVDKNGDCWIWTAARDHGGDGYGRFNVNGTFVPAHRLSWEMVYGPIFSGLHCLHKCDNRACVNPEHLFLGTHKDNMKDRGSKGRTFKPTGSINKKAKLDESDIPIIQQWLSDGWTRKQCAEIWSVHKSTIGRVARKDTWSHVYGRLMSRW